MTRLLWWVARVAFIGGDLGIRQRDGARWAESHIDKTDRSAPNTNGEDMETTMPTHYKGVAISYVVNDVAPDTETACIHMPDADWKPRANPSTTSERIFRDRAAWLRDITGKIDDHLDRMGLADGEKGIPVMHLPPLGS